jgi:hypothetical protein
MESTTTNMEANMQRIVGRSLMTRSEKASMKNRNKVSSGVISIELIVVPKLRRRSFNDRWIPFKFLKEAGPLDLIVDKKNVQKRRTDLKNQI